MCPKLKTGGLLVLGRAPTADGSQFLGGGVGKGAVKAGSWVGLNERPTADATTPFHRATYDSLERLGWFEVAHLVNERPAATCQSCSAGRASPLAQMLPSSQAPGLITCRCIGATLIRNEDSCLISSLYHVGHPA